MSIYPTNLPSLSSINISLSKKNMKTPTLPRYQPGSVTKTNSNLVVKSTASFLPTIFFHPFLPVAIPSFWANAGQLRLPWVFGVNTVRGSRDLVAQKTSPRTLEQWSVHPGWLGYIVDYTTLGILISHNKDPYKPTRIQWNVKFLMECHVPRVLIASHLGTHNRPYLFYGKLQTRPYKMGPCDRYTWSYGVMGSMAENTWASLGVHAGICLAIRCEWKIREPKTYSPKWWGFFMVIFIPWDPIRKNHPKKQIQVTMGSDPNKIHQLFNV